MNRLFQRHIALPQDHGSWVFIFSPLLIGLFAGKNFNAASLALIVAALAAFLIRQPVTIAVKAYTGRRSRTALPSARFWMLMYGVLILLSVFELIHLGYTTILWLAIPAAPVFAWHLWLVSKREERHQVEIEILATGVLALAAPAAFWVGKGSYDPLGWWLWISTWFQSAASIVHAYLRLAQRDWQSLPALAERFQAGERALTYTTFNLLLAAALSAFAIIAPFVWLAYLLQFGETLWGAAHPASGAKPIAIGMRQLLVSILFTVVFVITWH